MKKLLLIGSVVSFLFVGCTNIKSIAQETNINKKDVTNNIQTQTTEYKNEEFYTEKNEELNVLTLNKTTYSTLEILKEIKEKVQEGSAGCSLRGLYYACELTKIKTSKEEIISNDIKQYISSLSKEEFNDLKNNWILVYGEYLDLNDFIEEDYLATAGINKKDYIFGKYGPVNKDSIDELNKYIIKRTF